MGVIEETPMLKAPLFDFKTIGVKDEDEARERGYIYIGNDDIEEIYKTQFPEKKQDIKPEEMRKDIC